MAKAKVGLAKGTAFDPKGEGYPRLCFAREPAVIAAPVERLRPVLDEGNHRYPADIKTPWFRS